MISHGSFEKYGTDMTPKLYAILLQSHKPLITDFSELLTFQLDAIFLTLSVQLLYTCLCFIGLITVGQITVYLCALEKIYIL
jgi:hypothetical protein